MSVSRVHTRFGVKLRVDAMVSDVLIGGIVRQQIRNPSDVRRERTSGSPYPSFIGLYGQKPMASAATYAVAALLDELGVTGLPITSATNPGVVFYAQKYSEGSTPTSGSNHRSYTLKSGILLPRRLTCEHQGDAVLDFEALVTYDGTNAPIVVADSVALPSGLTDAERFTLGPVSVAGVTLPQVTSVEIDFGLVARSIGSDSDVWDTFSWIAGIEPTITLSGIDIEWLKSSNIPLTGETPAHADTSVILRKRTQDGDSFVADGTSEHIEFTMAGIAVPDELFNQSGDEAGTCSVILTGNYDGTNLPLVVDTTAAIS